MSAEVSARGYAPRGLVRTGAMIGGLASVVGSAWAGAFATVAKRPKRDMKPIYPRRSGYLDDAVMYREMRRL